MAKKGDVKEELRKAFEEADVHKRGYLTIPETKEVLERILEFSLEDRLTNRIIKKSDVDHSGNINFDEFCRSAKDLVSALMEIAREFRRVDKDMSGHITLDEMADLLNQCSCGGLSPEDHAVQDFVRSLDKDGDGRINFHEFIYFMANDICDRQDRR